MADGLPKQHHRTIVADHGRKASGRTWRARGTRWLGPYAATSTWRASSTARWKCPAVEVKSNDSRRSTTAHVRTFRTIYAPQTPRRSLRGHGATRLAGRTALQHRPDSDSHRHSLSTGRRTRVRAAALGLNSSLSEGQGNQQQDLQRARRDGCRKAKFPRAVQTSAMLDSG